MIGDPHPASCPGKPDDRPGTGAAGKKIEHDVITFPAKSEQKVGVGPEVFRSGRKSIGTGKRNHAPDERLFPKKICQGRLHDKVRLRFRA
jgi:hypothetical protein